MDTAAFWQLVDGSRRADGDLEAQCDELEAHLAQLEPESILEFQRCFATQVGMGYSWELWAVAETVLGSCSDESFERFLGWLVAQGRDYFSAALADPRRAADRVAPGQRPLLARMWTVPAKAYERATGLDDFYDIAHAVSVAMFGERLGRAQIEARFPELCRRFAVDD